MVGRCTPARVARRLPHGAAQTLYGLEFINIGNLYAQLDNAMGRYFNRRKGLRVEPALDASIQVRIAKGADIYSGRVCDLSRVGMGVQLDHISGQKLVEGTEVELTFMLPERRKELRGPAVVRQHKQLGELSFVGFAFDLECSWGFAQSSEVIGSYVLLRHEEMAAFEESFEDSLEDEGREAA